MHRTRRSVAGLGAVLLAATTLAACDSGSATRAPSSSPSANSASRSHPTAPSTSRSPATSSSSSRSSSSHSSPAPTDSNTPAQDTARRHLPRGGTKIIGHYRVVAYYGAAGTAQLGVLGARAPEQMVTSLEHRAEAFAGYGLPVQPAMELIATVARPGPGPDGHYSSPIPRATIKQYLQTAHRHKLLLILDLQPGRASFLEQAKGLAWALKDPCVSLALDPEWKVGPNQTPGGGRIGSTDAAGVNAVSRYVSRIVEANRLPDKMLVVHEFTTSMLPDRDRIDTHDSGVQLTFHADGFGVRAEKIGVFHHLAFPGHPTGVGFKLFLKQDPHMMSPADVMALHPRPDVITYE